MSKKRTRYSFKSLHKWIDKYQKKEGINHRIKRHAFNKKDEKEILDFWTKRGERWGRKAVVEWLFHIALDNLDTSFRKAKRVYNEKDVHNFFKIGFDPILDYVHSDSRHLNVDDLKEEFKK